MIKGPHVSLYEGDLVYSNLYLIVFDRELSSRLIWPLNVGIDIGINLYVDINRWWMNQVWNFAGIITLDLNEDSNTFEYHLNLT